MQGIKRKTQEMKYLYGLNQVSGTYTTENPKKTGSWKQTKKGSVWQR